MNCRDKKTLRTLVTRCGVPDVMHALTNIVGDICSTYKDNPEAIIFDFFRAVARCSGEIEGERLNRIIRFFAQRRQDIETGIPAATEPYLHFPAVEGPGNQ